ncbi:hypothetical protein, partial [Paraglaciecola sp.]|uniref:hypothetical protein n=1 Tax=Paraglaciecola sp. TaxID=1920173 RepID=UPI00273E4980
MTKENSFSDLFNVTTEGKDVSPVELTSPYLEPFSDLSAFTIIQRDEAIHRHNIIKFLIKEGVNAFTEKQLTHLLSALVTEFGGPAPNVRTLARWWSLFKSSNFNIVSLVPTIQAGNKKSKIVPELEPLISKTIDRLMSAERPNLAEGYRYLEDLVFRHNKENKLQLNCISSEALRLRVSKITPFEKFKAKKGLTAAKFEFKSIGKKIATSRVLERVEADHTRFDLFVVDDIYQVPMGRPWLTLLIDSLSLSVVGFYLGFEPPSFVSICHAIKNAILPKEYVKASYPSIKTEWLCSGLIETLVTDNGKEFDDKDFKQTCYELGINVAKNPTKKPHLKSSIERYFGALNTQLLANQPGKTFSNIIAREDYDPEKNAVISLSDIQLVVHKWIIEIYQAQPNSRWSNMPNLSWLTAAKAFPPQPY